VNQPGITRKGLRCRDVLEIIVRPHPVLIPEGAQTGFGGNAGTCENDYVQGALLLLLASASST
jgi:hypothetical protein